MLADAIKAISAFLGSALSLLVGALNAAEPLLKDSAYLLAAVASIYSILISHRILTGKSKSK